jgi:hypothetical protein
MNPPLRLPIVKVFSLNFFATAAGDGTPDYHMLCGDVIYENHCFGTTGTVKPQPLCSMPTYQTRDTQQLIDNFRYVDLPRRQKLLHDWPTQESTHKRRFTRDEWRSLS